MCGLMYPVHRATLETFSCILIPNPPKKSQIFSFFITQYSVADRYAPCLLGEGLGGCLVKWWDGVGLDDRLRWQKNKISESTINMQFPFHIHLHAFDFDGGC